MIQNISLTAGRQPVQCSRDTRRSRRGERPLANGHSLIPMMALRLATPRQPIDPRSIQKLKGVSRNDQYVVIGAMITQHELQASEGIAISLRTLDAGREAC